jgi:SWI/SNF-related matrix-associated actin-dependent regulator 1 of chromatin subfamily A
VIQVEVDGDWLVLDVPPWLEGAAKSLGARQVKGRWRLAASLMNARAVDQLFPGAGAATVVRARPWEAVGRPDLFPYQREAAGRLKADPRGQLLVLSPGLGKTAVTIAAADALEVVTDGPDAEGLLVTVVCPAPLVKTWEREIERWSVNPTVTWRVTTWDKFKRFGKGDAPSLGGDVLVLDESVLAKSRRSQRYEAVEKARRYYSRVWLLSGSPTTRHADDLWTQLHTIWPAAFPSYWRFAKRYCVVEETVWGDKVTGDKPGTDPMRDNADLVHVVNQEDVLELPEYLFEAVDVDLLPKQRRAYDSMLRDFVAELDGGDQVLAENEVAKLVRLQQIVSYWDGKSAKHDALLELIEGYEPPYLIWCHWKEGQAALTERLMAAGVETYHVDGSVTGDLRDYKLESFKRGHADALVLSLGVGKFGHTFTNTKTVIYIDKTWSADDYFQSLRRVRRIGLKHRPVVASFRAPGTTDDLVEDNLEGKLGSMASLTRSKLRELLLGLGRERG